MHRVKLRVISGLTVLFISLIFVFPAQSRNYYRDNIQVQVISDRRGTLREYPVKNNVKKQRSYIAVQKSERYRIRIRNNNNTRVGVVIAVDGRNIISGRRSDLRASEAIYVLEPWETAEYSGWRTSKNKENRFYFTHVEDSYADAWGDRSAMGVIAVAAFPEKFHELRPKNISPGRRSQRDYFTQNQRQDSAGTGFGEENWSPSRRVDFVAGPNPFMRKFIKYEWRKTLCRRGVISCREHHRHQQQQNRFWPDDELSWTYAPYPPPRRHMRDCSPCWKEDC